MRLQMMKYLASFSTVRLKQGCPPCVTPPEVSLKDLHLATAELPGCNNHEVMGSKIPNAAFRISPIALVKNRIQLIFTSQLKLTREIVCFFQICNSLIQYEMGVATVAKLLGLHLADSSMAEPDFRGNIT